jgi:outer membrane protein assembly factor BamB
MARASDDPRDTVGGRHGLGRRGALLAGAGIMLSGCETLTDMTDSVLGRRKVPLPGERLPVLSVEQQLEVDEGGAPIELPAPALIEAWEQAGGTPTHAPGHPSLALPIAQRWSTSVGSGASYRRRLTAPPVVADGTAYAMDAFGQVTAVELDRGRQRWSKDTRPRRDRDGALGGGCAFDGGVLYVVTGLAEAMALDPADGGERWRVSLPAPARGAPTVAGGRVFVPTVENQLLALSAENGERQWTYRAQAAVTIALGLPAPAVEGETVVAGFGSGELAAIRVADGRAVWTEALTSARGGGFSDIAAITAMPVIDRGRVIAAGLGGLVISLDLRTGRRLWERDLAVGETPWSAGDAVYAVSTGGDLVCFGRDDGRVRWLRALGAFEQPARRRGPITWGPPALAGGRVLIAGSHGRLVMVDPLTGEPQGDQRLSGPTTLAPAFVRGGMLLLTDNANLVWMQGTAATG